MMWLNLIIIAVVITGFFMLSISLKLIFNKDSEIKGHSCHLEEESADDGQACSHCQLKDIADCKEKPLLNH